MAGRSIGRVGLVVSLMAAACACSRAPSAETARTTVNDAGSACPGLTGPAAEGTDASAAEVQAFVGTWARGGMVVETCGSSQTTSELTGNLVIAPGATGGTVATLSPNGCVTSYSVQGTVATAAPGQACYEASGAALQVETVGMHTLTLSAGGMALASSSATTIIGPDAGTSCATTSSGTFSKTAGDGDAGAFPSVCTDGPCCVARMTVPGSSFSLPYYSTLPLGTPSSEVSSAIMFIQGFDHDARNDFSTLVTATAMAGHLGDTVVVAPHFEVVDPAGACGGSEPAAPTDLTWSCDGWTRGLSAGDATVTSYAALDALIGLVEATFPQLQRVIVAGFSAGGQLVDRYAATNGVDGQGSPIRYVVGDPSSYLYLDATRPVDAGGCTTLACPQNFAAFPGASQCAGFNDWPFGTGDLEGAAAALSPPQLRQQFVQRDVHYLFGALDNAATAAADYSELDTSCGAEAQGPFRLQRGLAFYAYSKTVLGAGQQQASVVPGCAHSAPCVFQSNPGIAAMFGP